MADPKTDQYTQFARVSNPDGSSPIAAASPNEALAPLVDAAGRLIVVPFTGGPIPSTDWLRSDSAGPVTTKQIKASAGRLFQAWGMQIAESIYFLQMYDQAAGPPVGVPFVSPLPVLVNGVWSINVPNGLAFSNGILIAWSLAAYSYVAPEGPGGWITGLYL